MPEVLNIRHLPGFSERCPVIPPSAVYIGRANARYRLNFRMFGCAACDRKRATDSPWPK